MSMIQSFESSFFNIWFVSFVIKSPNLCSNRLFKSPSLLTRKRFRNSLYKVFFVVNKTHRVLEFNKIRPLYFKL